MTATIAAAPQVGWAWGIHSLLTQSAIQRLPAWQREAIQAEARGLVQRFCIFPDDARAADAAPYVVKFPPEAKVSHHIPASLEHNKQLFDAYLPRIATLLKDNQLAEAMRYFGCVAHFIEDSSAPCHMAYGETRVPDDGPPLLQMDYFKRFLPHSERLEATSLHSRIDACPMTQQQLDAAVADYRPRLLGHSVEELTFNLLEEHVQMNLRSSRQVFPMLKALADDDEPRFVACGVVAAADGSRLVADVLYSLLCIARSRFDAPPPDVVSLADRTPARGTPFAWTDRNHQGRLLRNASGAIADNSSEPPKLGRHPLKLAGADGTVREIAKGYGVGWRTEYTFFVPKGVFKTFRVEAGNDAALGTESINTFEVLLDGRAVAATGPLKGAAAGQRLEVPLGDAATITLRCKSEGPPSRTHGVWAEPTLLR